MREDDKDLLDVLELITAGKQPERDELICIAAMARERLETLLETCRKINALAGEESLQDVLGVMVQGLLRGVITKVELELPALPDGWADGPVEIKYGHAPKQSLILAATGWVPHDVFYTGLRVYAVRKWLPQIVTAGVLAPGWVVIDPDGTCWNSKSKPVWNEAALEWDEIDSGRLRLKEKPIITGQNAIWEIK